MSCLKQFEHQVLSLLLADCYQDDVLERVLRDVEFVSFEYTGVGYYLTLRHASFPTDKTVCSAPTLLGKARGFECGFVVFLQDGLLTLECHDWSGGGIPEDVREHKIKIRTV